MQIELKRLHEDAIIPSYATPGSAAVDLSCIEGVTIHPGETTTITTGIAIHIANPNYAAIILPRSGLGKRGLILANTIGLIDSDYQGELLVQVWNRDVEGCIILQKHERFAQLMIIPIVKPLWNVVESFSQTTDRNTQGWGSTGV